MQLIEAKKQSQRNEIANATLQRVNGELVIRNSNWMMERITREETKTRSNQSHGVILEVGVIISYNVRFDICYIHKYESIDGNYILSSDRINARKCT
jgi:3-phenylpropionate/cinnamic acid dioxygenase small subunit